MENELRIFSVSVCAEAQPKILEKLKNMLDGEAQSKIFTPNTEMLLAASKDPSVTKLLNSAELLIPDGIGIKIASHILSSPIPTRISGIDMAFELLKIAEVRNLSVFLLGGKPTVAQRAAEKLKSELPRLNICGAHHGYFEKSGAENAAVIEEIRKASPDILFVCFGFPMQERWICENLTATALPSVRVAMGLGGSLDVWAGDKKRAPVLIQKLGFEWLWRALPEPKRLKILLEIPEFLYRSAKQKRRAEL